MHYTLSELKSAYSSHFLGSDVIYLSSSLGLLGSISDSNIKSGIDLARLHLDIILDSLSDHQTLLVPGFSYSFNADIDNYSHFSLSHSPPTIGDLPLCVFKDGSFSRSVDPFLSVFAFGPLASKLIQHLPYTSYGSGSIFDRLRSTSCRVISVGLGSHWLPFVHHADFLCNTPFRYPKIFHGDITIDNLKTSVKWTYHVRLPVQNTYPHTYQLASLCTPSANSLCTELGRSTVYSYDYSTALDTALPIISTDPWLSVVGPPLNGQLLRDRILSDITSMA